MTEIQRIQRAVRQGRYVFTDHAIAETHADNLLLRDVVKVLLTGEVDSSYTDDPRGIRYVIRGDVDAVEVDVVCRFSLENELIILTVYVVE